MFRCLLNYSFNLIIWIYSCFPTMGNTSKRDAGDKKSDATQKSPPLLKFVSSFDKRRRQAKRNTSSVTTQGKKSQRKGGQSPSFSTFAEAFKSEHQQHKKKTVQQPGKSERVDYFAFLMGPLMRTQTNRDQPFSLFQLTKCLTE
ncbi:hypothetical protein MAR_013947 [Mya arenaria]|uniref:Uncharacterized protein n=1 Tax=Mya arenaria TaxID=6604 RepID=A0ABY7G1B6_MYAAR|nr:hypothetical protein MAR_013947 [Mya arenaria]